MFCWAQIDPADDIWIVAEGQIDGDPLEVRECVDGIEEGLALLTAQRLMDPNMGASPASARRGVNWQDEFSEAGLMCDLADDHDVGRSRVNEYLKPDPDTLRPRLHIHERCSNCIAHMKRYSWDEFRHGAERDLKQKPRDKYDDYPSMLRYLMNYQPSFKILHQGHPIITRPGTRKGAYG